MDVRLPNGKLIKGVPEGTPRAQIQQKAVSAGLASPDDFSGREDGQQPSTSRELPKYLQGASSQSPITAGVSDQFANPQRQAIGMGAAPEPVSGRPSGFMAGFKAGFVRDPQTKLKILSEEIFPDDPNAIKRFGYIDGDPVYINDAGRIEKAISGAGAQVGSAVANAPEAIGATIGSFATGNPATGAIVGDVGGRAVKQAIGSTVFGEPQDAQENIMDLAQEGALATTGAAVGKMGTMFGNRRAVSGLDRFNLKNAIDVKDRIKKATGVDLDVAQASQLSGMKALRKWAMKFPSDAAEVMDNFSKLQQGQSQEAVEGILKTLSSKSNLRQAGESPVNAAKAAIEVAKKQREDAASPFYRQAFESGAQVDARPIIKKINMALNNAKGPVRRDLKTAKSHFYKNVKKQTDQGTETVKALDNSIEGLHGTKIALDAMLSRRGGATSAENMSQRELVGIQKELVERLAQASPEYEAGRSAFEKMSQQLVNPLEDSPIGALAKLKNKRVAKAASEVFSETPDVDSVRFAKRVIQNQDPQAWKDLVRQKLQTDLEKAMQITGTGEIVNLEGKFLKAAAGTRAKREALEAALDKDMIDTTGNVLDAFEMIANSPIHGSDTAFNQAITEQQRQSGINVLARALTPLKSIAEASDEAFLQKHSTAIAEALTDPQKIKQVRKLLELPKGLERSIQIVSTVMPARGGQKMLEPGPSFMEPELMREQEEQQ